MDALLNIRVIRCSVSFMLSDLRSNRPEVFSEKGVIKNFTKFTGKHLCQILFFFRPATLLKKRLCHRCFPANFVKFSRTPFFIEHLRWLLLEMACYYRLEMLLSFREICQFICSANRLTEAVVRRCSVKKMLLKFS